MPALLKTAGPAFLWVLLEKNGSNHERKVALRAFDRSALRQARGERIEFVFSEVVL